MPHQSAQEAPADDAATESSNTHRNRMRDLEDMQKRLEKLKAREEKGLAVAKTNEKKVRGLTRSIGSHLDLLADKFTEESESSKREVRQAREDVEESLRIASSERERAEWFQKRVEELEEQLKGGGGHGEPKCTTPTRPICQICGFEFDEHPDKIPRVLGCGHSVCEKCAQTLCKNEAIKCPFDRTDTALRMGRAGALPKNYTVMEMISGREKKSGHK